MNLPRIFANAIARRVAYVVVALALSFLGIDAARAAVYPDQGAAYSACNSSNAETLARLKNSTDPVSAQKFTGKCVAGSGQSQEYGRYASQILYGGSHYGFYDYFDYLIANKCSSRPDYNGAYPYQQFGTPRSGSTTCFNGCTEIWTPNADGTYNGSMTLNSVCSGPYDDAKCKAENGAGSYFNKHLSACEPEEEGTCPEGQEKNAAGDCTVQNCPAGKKLQADGTCKNEKNECPAGNVKSPTGACLPGDGQCAEGEARGKDGTCKRDADGDGKPDEGEDEGDTKNTFSGGDDCKSPPSCSGSPIMCGQARIQWRIDCNTRKNRNIAGGHCGAGGVPVCTGEKCDAVEYAQLVQTWKSACAMEKLAGKGDGDGGQPEWTKVTGDGTEGAGSDADKPHRNVSLGTGRLDDSGFLGGSRSCPQFPVADLGMLGTWDPNELPYICQFVALVRWALILLGAFIAFRIMAGS